MGRAIYKAHPSDRWYTPAAIRGLAQKVLGPIDLDPATDDLNPLGARYTITKKEDGRAEHWGPLLQSRALARGHATIWINPPYGLGIDLWFDRLRETREALPQRLRALVLVPARPGAAWYERATTEADAVCELRGRLTFEVRKRRRLVPSDYPARWGCALLYFGNERAKVARALRPWGATRLVGRAELALPFVDPRQTTNGLGGA